MASLTVKIPIPDFTKALYDQAQQSIIGQSWTMSDLRKWLGGKSVTWIKSNILYNPKYSHEIASMEAKGQIHISSGKGNAWRFKATAMAEFIEQHYEEFDWKGK